MTQEQLEGNKLIAAFDGWILTIGEFVHAFNGPDSKPEENKRRNRLIGFEDCIRTDELQYHSSWDWQIEPWRKVIALIRPIAMAHSELRHPDIERYFILTNKYHNAIDHNKPEDGQLILIEAIMWYNQQIKAEPI